MHMLCSVKGNIKRTNSSNICVWCLCVCMFWFIELSDKKLHYVVPQVSVLGPILFPLYIQPLSEVISRSMCGHHKFTDDTQLHQSSDWLLTLSSVLNLSRDGWLVIGWSWTMTKLKLFWLDFVEGSACHRLTTWELAIMMFPSKALLKIFGFTSTEAYWPHQSFSISRDKKN